MSWLGRLLESDLNARLTALETHVKALYDHVREIEKHELTRQAEHTTMVDQLERLYRRFSSRIARERRVAGEQQELSGDESPLDLRRRLGR